VACLIDTNIAILLRDGDPSVMAVDAPVRRARLDAMLSAIPVLAFDELAAAAYGAIVAQAGYSRRKLLDRMIAAQAIVHRARLATMNAGDFSDIVGLEIESW
jgi:tRNA(fMet)-specific endonuclease VapC